MIALIILLLIDAYILCSMSKTVAVGVGAVAPGDYVVYGTMGCGWTRKQLDLMKEKNISHEFVDCSKKGSCPPGVKAYPTIKHPDGKMTTGFNTLEES
jgi:hypothetical protein